MKRKKSKDLNDYLPDTNELVVPVQAKIPVSLRDAFNKSLATRGKITKTHVIVAAIRKFIDDNPTSD